MQRLRKLTFVLTILLVLAVVLPERPAVVMVLVIDPISDDPELRARVIGCDAAQSRELADVFLGKGASLYVSWDGPVYLEYTDLVFERILSHFTDGKTMDETVEMVSHELGEDPHFKSVLRCFKR